jgi:UDP-glucose 4-epimerase
MIPAYEDGTLVNTVNDCIKNADRPESLSFAIAMQYKECPYPDVEEFRKSPNFIFVDYDVDSRPGVMQLRNRLARLHSGQEYVLLCDSHTTFVQGWDTKLINDYLDLQSKHGHQVIISAQMGEDTRHIDGNDQNCNCKDYDGPQPHAYTVWNKPESEVTNFDFLHAEPKVIISEHQDFVPTYYSSHHMFFFHHDYIKDGWMFDSARNYGEETFSSYIAFMRGWTIYRSYKNVYMYHNQNANGNYSEIAKTKTFSALTDRGRTIYQIIRSMLYNVGPYKINSDRQPRDFYVAIGLEKEYDRIIELGLFSDPEAPDFGEQPISIVTGGAGFIGSNLVDRLISLGHKVIVIDNESSESHDQFYWNDQATNCKLDITNYDDTRHIYNGADYVFHLAAQPRIQPSIQEDPTKTIHTNVYGTSVVLQCAREAMVQRVILASTSSIYGNGSLPNKESDPANCLNPYSASKLAAENIANIYKNLFNLDVVILRYFNVYGLREPVRGSYAPVVGRFLKQFFSDEPLTIVGDGGQRRDFTHVDDVVSATISAATCTIPDNNIINVGTGTNFSINEIAGTISNNVEYVDSRKGEAQNTLADISSAASALGYSPSKSVIDYIIQSLY